MIGTWWVFLLQGTIYSLTQTLRPTQQKNIPQPHAIDLCPLRLCSGAFPIRWLCIGAFSVVVDNWVANKRILCTSMATPPVVVYKFCPHFNLIVNTEIEEKDHLNIATSLSTVLLSYFGCFIAILTLNSISDPSITSKLCSPRRTNSFLRTQCAAVRTHSGETNVPPQNASWKSTNQTVVSVNING